MLRPVAAAVAGSAAKALPAAGPAEGCGVVAVGAPEGRLRRDRRDRAVARVLGEGMLQGPRDWES